MALPSSGFPIGETAHRSMTSRTEHADLAFSKMAVVTKCTVEETLQSLGILNAPISYSDLHITMATSSGHLVFSIDLKSLFTACVMCHCPILVSGLELKFYLQRYWPGPLAVSY